MEVEFLPKTKICCVCKQCKLSKQGKRCKHMDISGAKATMLVRVSNKTHSRLDKLRAKGESYDKVIIKLLDASIKEAKLRIDEK